MGLVISPAVTTHYDVDGSTLADVAAAFAARKEAGHCDWNFLPYEFEAASRDGKPRSLNLTLEISIDLPRWTGRDGATTDEQREWDRVYEALRRHEEEHARIAREGAPAMYDAMMAARVRDLAAVFSRERARIDRTQKTFDRDTKHGQEPPPGTTIRIPPP